MGSAVGLSYCIPYNEFQLRLMMNNDSNITESFHTLRQGTIYSVYDQKALYDLDGYSIITYETWTMLFSRDGQFRKIIKIYPVELMHILSCCTR